MVRKSENGCHICLIISGPCLLTTNATYFDCYVMARSKKCLCNCTPSGLARFHFLVWLHQGDSAVRISTHSEFPRIFIFKASTTIFLFLVFTIHQFPIILFGLRNLKKPSNISVLATGPSTSAHLSRLMLIPPMARLVPMHPAFIFSNFPTQLCYQQLYRIYWVGLWAAWTDLPWLKRSFPSSNTAASQSPEKSDPEG